MNARRDGTGVRFASHGRVRGLLAARVWGHGGAFAPRRVIGKRAMRRVARRWAAICGAIGGMTARRAVRAVTGSGGGGAKATVQVERAAYRAVERADIASGNARSRHGMVDAVRRAVLRGPSMSMGAVLAARSKAASGVKRQSRLVSSVEAPTDARVDRGVPGPFRMRRGVARAGDGVVRRVAAGAGGGVKFRSGSGAAMRGVGTGEHGGVPMRSMAPVGREPADSREDFAMAIRQADRHAAVTRSRPVDYHGTDVPKVGDVPDRRPMLQTAGPGVVKAAAVSAVQPHDMVRLMGDLFADEGRRPPSGVTGFDGRLSPIFAGRKPGF